MVLYNVDISSSFSLPLSFFKGRYGTVKAGVNPTHGRRISKILIASRARAKPDQSEAFKMLIILEVGVLSMPLFVGTA